MNQLDPNFDWVSARADCSPEKSFAALKEQIKGDIERRNSLLGATELHYAVKFQFASGSGAFKVARTMAEDMRENAVFSQTEDGIKVVYGRDMNRASIEVALTLANDQECKLRVGDQELSFWQFRKLALEPILFAPTVGW